MAILVQMLSFRDKTQQPRDYGKGPVKVHKKGVFSIISYIMYNILPKIICSWEFFVIPFLTFQKLTG